MKFQKTFFIINFILLSFLVSAQKADFSQVWPAKWVIPQDAPAKAYSVHHFRKTFELERVPDSLLVHTSGDNRYQLFVNGKMVTWGPLRGDLRHWFYETTDIAPFLKPGKNTLAAVVLNYGSHPPDAQLTVQTGFLLAADDNQYKFLNTNESWKGKFNPAYSPSLVEKNQVNGYYGAGSKEIIDGNKYLWGWEKTNYNDTDWQSCALIETAFAKTCKWASRWKLTPRNLPHEILTEERFREVRFQENIKVPEGFLQYPGSLLIPPNTTCKLVIDQGYLTTAYPVLTLSGGKHTLLKMTYVEAPYIGDPKHKQKGNRNKVEGKNFIGVFDRFIADGGEKRTFKPLWWRAFRYIELTITTKTEALDIIDFYSIHSTYPFKQKAKIIASDKGGLVDSVLINKIMEIGNRTLLACAHEHFMDCPYYEESQFEGDARVEMLVSYYNYGDPALGKQAIEQFSWSVNEEGFLSARYPTNSLYFIPNFSIYWIGMLYDYMMLYDDPEFVSSKLSIVRHLMDYFARNERIDGTLSKLDYHQFVDWAFKAGEPPFNEMGYSAITDLHYLLALQWAIALEKELGESYFSKKYSTKANKLSQTIKKLYWDEKIGLFTDIPHDNSKLSQHTNCLAILTGVIKRNEASEVMKKVIQNDSNNMVEATLYWQYYVFEALQEAGLGDKYLDHLSPWEKVIDLGVTTWPEKGPESRSECHGWGSSPNYHLLKIVAGIMSGDKGFKNIIIKPSMGNIEELEVEMPHHMGNIRMKLSRKGKHILGKVSLPSGTNGSFIWNNKEQELHEGIQDIKF